AEDVIVFEEPDERFWVRVGLTRSERYVGISVASALTSEVWLLDAAAPTAPARMVLPRRQGVEYSVEHQAGPGRLLILHNDGALNFELATVPLPSADTGADAGGGAGAGGAGAGGAGDPAAPLADPAGL